jgi:SAM-dependent methyltransferase
MNTKYLKYLRSPKDNTSELEFNDDTLIDKFGNIYPIVNNIPRFVLDENYSKSFGFQWNIFNKTQLDIKGHISISENRFYNNTRWLKEELKDKKILEVGSGAGRFTDVILNTDAELYTVDYSNAVEANFISNKDKKDFFIAQASVYELPFEKNSFDYVFCFGVIQHTPDVKESFMCLVDQVKPGGKISIDVYKRNWKSIFLSKYWFRPLTKRMSHELLLKLINWYIPLWFPLSTMLLKIPIFGKFLCQIIPISNYSLLFPQLSKNQLIEWAILDTFDMLSPMYDQPQSLKTIISWAKEAKLNITYCGKGENGFVLNASK